MHPICLNFEWWSKTTFLDGLLSMMINLNWSPTWRVSMQCNIGTVWSYCTYTKRFVYFQTLFNWRTKVFANDYKKATEVSQALFARFFSEEARITSELPITMKSLRIGISLVKEMLDRGTRLEEDTWNDVFCILLDALLCLHFSEPEVSPPFLGLSCFVPLHEFIGIFPYW